MKLRLTIALADKTEVQQDALLEELELVTAEREGLTIKTAAEHTLVELLDVEQI